MRKLPILIILMLIVIPMVSATWFNTSYVTKFPVNCSKVLNGYPIAINGSQGVTITGEKQIIWTYCMGTGTALYYNSPTDYIVANNTKRLPFEVDIGNETSINATSVWSNYFVAVYHMNDRNDSLEKYDWGAGSTNPAKSTGFFGNGYTLTTDAINMTGLQVEHLDNNWTFMVMYNPVGSTPTTYGGIFYNAVGGDNGCMVSGNTSSMRCTSPYPFCDREFTMNWTKTGLVSWVQGVGGDMHNQSVFLNGSIVSGSDIHCTTWMDDYPVKIGLGDRSGRSFDGMIDELRVSNSSLDTAYQNYTYHNYLNTAGYGRVTALEYLADIVYYNNDSVSSILADSTANYFLEINKSAWSNAYAKLVWNGTYINAIKAGTGNWTFTASKLFPNSVGKSITYSWLMNLSNVNMTLNNQATIGYVQSIVGSSFGVCSGNLSTIALSFNLFDEDSLDYLNDTEFYGNYQYWVSSKSEAVNGTFNSGDLVGFNASLTNNYEEVNATSITQARSSANITFIPFVSSIISEIGVVFKIVPENITFALYENNCTEGIVLYNQSIKIDTNGLSGHNYYNFTMEISNYTSGHGVMTAGNQYCYQLNSTHQYGTADIGEIYQEGIPSSASNIIFTYNSQNVNTGNRTGYPSFKITEVSYNDKVFCIYPSTAEFKLDMEIISEANLTGRYYLLNASISDAITSISLYGINDSTDYENAKINLVDSSYNPLKNYYTKLLRYYPDSNLWRTVQMYKSDEFGSNYFDVLETTIDYKLIVQNYDTTVRTTNTINFKRPYGGDIVIEILVNPDSDLYNIYDGYNYTYNSLTKIFSLKWNDVTGTTSSVTLTALSNAVGGSVLWCNSTSLGSAGTINCNLSSSSGSILVTGYRTSSSTISVLFNKYISEISNSLYDAMDAVGLGKDAMFWAFVICCIIIIAGAFYPLSLLVSIPVSLLIVSLLGITNFMTGSMIVGSIIFAIIIGMLVKK
jgi:hypothetical protein